MKRILILGAVVLLSACGGSGGGGSSVSTGKSLFSSWYQSDAEFTLDLTGLSFTTAQAVIAELDLGEQCGLDLTISGTQSSGTYQLSNGVYLGGGFLDPDCTQFESIGTYTKTATTLTICDNDGCFDYE